MHIFRSVLAILKFSAPLLAQMVSEISDGQIQAPPTQNIGPAPATTAETLPAQPSPLITSTAPSAQPEPSMATISPAAVANTTIAPPPAAPPLPKSIPMAPAAPFMANASTATSDTYPTDSLVAAVSSTAADLNATGSGNGGMSLMSSATSVGTESSSSIATGVVPTSTAEAVGTSTGGAAAVSRLGWVTWGFAGTGLWIFIVQ